MFCIVGGGDVCYNLYNFEQCYRSDKVVYAKQNGGKFNFILEEKSHKAVPIDQVSATIMLIHLSHR